MNKYETLYSNTLLITAGTFLSKVMMFVMVRFYTGWLDPAEYGTADLVTQVANLILPAASLGITDGVFRFALSRPKDRGRILTDGVLVVLAGTAVSSVLLPLLPFSTLRTYGRLTALFVCASCFHSLAAQFIRAEGHMRLYAWQGVFGTLLMIGLDVLFLAVLDMGVAGYVLAIALSDVGITIFLVVAEKLWKRMVFPPDKALLRGMLRYSVPLIPTGVFWWITSVSDRVMITHFLGAHANGLYTIAGKIPNLLILLSGVFLQAWQFSAVREDRGGPRAYGAFYSKIWRMYRCFLVLACSLIIALSYPEIRIIAEESYEAAWRYLPLLALAMLFSAYASFLGSVYVVRMESMRTFWTALAAAVINVVCNLLLIPSPLGAQGAAAATFLSYAAVFALRAASVRRMIPIRLDLRAVTLTTAVLLVQAWSCVRAVPGWKWIQAGCVLVLAASCGGTIWRTIRAVHQMGGDLRRRLLQKGESS